MPYSKSTACSWRSCTLSYLAMERPSAHDKTQTELSLLTLPKGPPQSWRLHIFVLLVFTAIATASATYRLRRSTQTTGFHALRHVDLKTQDQGVVAKPSEARVLRHDRRQNPRLRGQALPYTTVAPHKQRLQLGRTSAALK